MLTKFGKRVKLKEPVTLTGFSMSAFGQVFGFHCCVLSTVLGELGVKNGLCPEQQSIWDHNVVSAYRRQVFGLKGPRSVLLITFLYSTEKHALCLMMRVL